MIPPTALQTENAVHEQHSEQQRKAMQIIESSLEEFDKKPTKFHVFGHDFLVKDQVAQAVFLIQGLKGIIDEAVKASPEVSLASAIHFVFARAKKRSPAFGFWV